MEGCGLIFMKHAGVNTGVRASGKNTLLRNAKFGSDPKKKEKNKPLSLKLPKARDCVTFRQFFY
ncbi:hypothetical protein DOZ58_12820 [Acetobacterium sp. KB-1]|jgi:hypothetical protein|nr:hypothetical protein DOZ58_12820 [Acetobacterium sp. KB-1]